MLTKKKIFLASSEELRQDREQFEIFINRLNKKWVDRSIFFELLIWEDFIDAMSKTRLQDEYNKAVKESDIFILLFFTKVGKYSLEEFETAFGHFQEQSKPIIYTYFKSTKVELADIDENILSMLNFKKRLRELGHFQINYTTIDDLKYRFNEQIDKLFLGETSNPDPNVSSGPTTIIHQQHSGSGDNIGGGKTEYK